MINSTSSPGKNIIHNQNIIIILVSFILDNKTAIFDGHTSSFTTQLLAEKLINSALNLEIGKGLLIPYNNSNAKTIKSRTFFIICQ